MRIGQFFGQPLIAGMIRWIVLLCFERFGKQSIDLTHKSDVRGPEPTGRKRYIHDHFSSVATGVKPP